MIEVVGDEWAQASHDVRSLLARIGIPFAFNSVTAPAGSATLQRVGRDGSTLPVLAFQSGIVLEDPSIAQIGAALGLLLLRLKVGAMSPSSARAPRGWPLRCTRRRRGCRRSSSSRVFQGDKRARAR